MKAPGASAHSGRPETAPTPERTNLIVGIGASAGGIDAFKTFFNRVPADIGMAFVVVQHLDPTYDSALPAIIAASSTLPTSAAEEGALVVPNHIFVIPPDAILTIKDGRLHLSRPARPPRARSRSTVS